MGLMMRIFLQFGFAETLVFRKEKKNICLFITQGPDVLII
jgi:hypothetical protein